MSLLLAAIFFATISSAGSLNAHTGRYDLPKNAIVDARVAEALKLETTLQMISDDMPGAESNPVDIPSAINGWSMILTLFGIFVGGIALNLTPCVYPLIPITVSFFAGRSGKGQTQLLLHSLCYTGGLAVTNSILGVVAALTGGLMGSILQNPVVLFVIAAILIFFATSLFGLWELQLPDRLSEIATKSHAGYLGSLFMGLTLGVVAAPCIGPFVLGLLTLVAALGSPWIGFIVFFTLSLGLGLPLLLLALFSGQVEKLPRAGEWTVWIRKLMGWVLVGMAFYFLKPLYPEGYQMLFFAMVAFAAGIHLGVFDKTLAGFQSFRWLNAVAGLIGFALSIFFIGAWTFQSPGLTWQSYSDELLDQAKRENKPVIIDFYAAWCPPCNKMEETTFRHPDIIKTANDFTMIKVDLTERGDPLHERLIKKYEVRGVPTAIFLDSQGNERRDLRLMAYEKPEDFRKRMEKLKLQNPETGKKV
jgi:thiol:disulfide interchange protein DsbD